MNRKLIASFAGIGGFCLYLLLAVRLADYLPANQIARFLYFLAAGVAWVAPARWLMLWSVGER
jgi:hypothetical protein